METIDFSALAAGRLLPIPMPSFVGRAAAELLGFRQAQSLYESLQTEPGEAHIGDRLISRLRVRIEAVETDIARVPVRGPAVVTSNHPYGVLDGAVLLHLLRKVRPDVKVLANGILAAIPEMRQNVIAVDPMGSREARRQNLSGVREAVDFVAGGGLLLVFPAGEVAHIEWRKWSVTDPEWSNSVARLIAMAARRTAGLRVVPAHVSGCNGALFQAAGLLHPKLRTALLAREFLNKRDAAVTVRFGGGVNAEKLSSLESDTARIGYMRQRTELLASRETYKPLTRMPLMRRGQTPALEPVEAPRDPQPMADEVLRLDASQRLASSGDLHALIARSEQIPALLAEIGRLREIAFRAAGEGTGKPTDLDWFDQHYLHLFVWNEAKQEVAGAYRIAPTDEVIQSHGLAGLYTSTLFRYSEEFVNRMGPALELGRSFVRVEYQKSFTPLLLLWKGIGRYIARRPERRVLFGPVSISNRYQAISRELMVSFLEKHAWLEEWAGLVGTRNPFRKKEAMPDQGFWKACTGVEELAQVVNDIEPGAEGVPVLLRQYLKLGGKLLAFNVDAEFSDALDGLIVVDLTKTEPKLLERYLGKAEANTFMRRHNHE